MKEYFKHLLIRTPLESIAKKLRSSIEYQKRLKKPQLKENFLESERIEQIMQQKIARHHNCLDIGAHLGSMLSTMTKLAPEGRHTAFEPTPYKAQWLRKKFPELKIHEVALGDKVGKATFYLDRQQSGFSGLQKHRKGKVEHETFEVNCDRLDNVLAPDYRVDFIKLDVEGGELPVLRGATNTLSAHRPTILFECSDLGLSVFGINSQEIFDFFEQHAYSIYLLKGFLAGERPLKLQEFEQALQDPLAGYNFIANAPK
jgi:FkbM family methyltransferase